MAERKTLLSNNLERVWKEDHERQRHVARPRQVAREEVVYDRVAPDTRRETQVRLGTHTMTADVHEDWMVYGNEEEVYDDDAEQDPAEEFDHIFGLYNEADPRMNIHVPEDPLSDEDEDVVIEDVIATDHVAVEDQARAEAVQETPVIEQEPAEDVYQADDIRRYYEGIWIHDRLKEESSQPSQANGAHQELEEHAPTILSSRSQALASRRSTVGSFSSGKVFYQRMLNCRGFPLGHRVSSENDDY